MLKTYGEINWSSYVYNINYNEKLYEYKLMKMFVCVICWRVHNARV